MSKRSITRKGWIISAVILGFEIVAILAITISLGVTTKRNSEKITRESANLLASKVGSMADNLLSGTMVLAETLSGNEQQLDSASRSVYNRIVCGAKKVTDAWVIWNSTFYGDSSLMENNWVLVSSDKEGNPIVKTSVHNFEQRFNSVVTSSTPMISDPYEFEGKTLVNISTPIYHDFEIQGFVGQSVETSVFDEVFNSALEASGTVVNSNGKLLVNLGDLSLDINEEQIAEYTTKAHSEGSYMFSDKYDSVRVLVEFMPIKLANNLQAWTLIYGVNQAAYFKSVNKFCVIAAIVGLLASVLFIMLIAYLFGTIAKPIKQTTEALMTLAKGDTENIHEIQINTGNELQDMGDSLNMVVDGIKKSADFAVHIGEGDFSVKYTKLSENDGLGMALMKMRDNLLENAENEKAHKQEEELRNWATEGIAKFGEILRQESDSLKSLGYNVMSSLVEYLNVNQGALFVQNDNDGNDIYFELVTAIAYGRDKFMKKEIYSGEGLIGRCIYEKKTIYLTEIPDDYVKITSGLGTANPSCVLIVPCMLNEDIYGVIELASFSEMKPYEIEFVEKLGESIASTVANVRTAERTQKLVNDSKLQNEELKAQEEEMRQNMEEMQATQEENQRQMEENLRIREEMNKETALLNALLDNISESIYFKDKDSRFIRASRSMIETFNMTSIDQLIGKSDRDFVPVEEADKYVADEESIMRTGMPILRQVQREVRYDGSVEYTSTSKYPLRDVDGNVIGTFGMSIDVTDAMNYKEKAQKTIEENKAMMDIIKQYAIVVEYDSEGVILSISPFMERLLGEGSANRIIGTTLVDEFNVCGREKSELAEIMSALKQGQDAKLSMKLSVNGKSIEVSEVYKPIIDDRDNLIKVVKLGFLS